VRLERDRRGGLRVLKGPALQQTPVARNRPSQVMEAGRLGTLDTQPVDAGDRFDLEEQAEEDRFNDGPMPTDTMAEPSIAPGPDVRAAASRRRACGSACAAKRDSKSAARNQAVEKAGRIPVPGKNKV
jgi:hypothetical protein